MELPQQFLFDALISLMWLRQRQVQIAIGFYYRRKVLQIGRFGVASGTL